MRRGLLFQVGSALLLSSFLASPAAPSLDHIFPAAVQAGSTNSVTVIGKFDPWPAKVWVDARGIEFKPETNSGKYSVEIAANAAVGPHLVRLFNEQGASAPRFLIVTREPQLTEVEPNDDFRKPQVIERLPAFINGRLDKSGDVESFAVTLDAGQTLVASVEAFVLASPVDAALRVVDLRGIQVAFNHDGTTLDPFLAWTAKSAGTYVVQLFGFAYPAESDVKFTGNSKCVYRLRLSRGPYLHHTLPLGVQRGAKTSLRLAGWNVLSHEAVPFDASGLGVDADQAVLSLPGFENTLLLPAGDGHEKMKPEANDSLPENYRLEVPSSITGCIEKPGEEDRFAFTAKKDEKFLIEVQSASLGFPLDAWLKVENSKGDEGARIDDAAGSDPRMEWTAPRDGDFTIAIGNILHRGGPDYLYRLTLRRAVPSVKINVSETAFAIAPGKTNELKVATKRLHGFKARLNLLVKNLPGGISALPMEVPEKGGEVTLKLMAEPNAASFGGLIQIAAVEVESGRNYLATADLTGSTVNNGVPGGFNKLLIESTDRFWLTVLPVAEQKSEKK